MKRVLMLMGLVLAGAAWGYTPDATTTVFEDGTPSSSALAVTGIDYAGYEYVVLHSVGHGLLVGRCISVSVIATALFSASNLNSNNQLISIGANVYELSSDASWANAWTVHVTYGAGGVQADADALAGAVNAQGTERYFADHVTIEGTLYFRIREARSPGGTVCPGAHSAVIDSSSGSWISPNANGTNLGALATFSGRHPVIVINNADDFEISVPATFGSNYAITTVLGWTATPMNYWSPIPSDNTDRILVVPAGARTYTVAQSSVTYPIVSGARALTPSNHYLLTAGFSLNLGTVVTGACKPGDRLYIGLGGNSAVTSFSFDK